MFGAELHLPGQPGTIWASALAGAACAAGAEAPDAVAAERDDDLAAAAAAPGDGPAGVPWSLVAILLLVRLPRGRFAAGGRLARRRRSRPFSGGFRSVPGLIMVNDTRCRSRSTESTQTVAISPTATISYGLRMNRFDI